MMEPANINKQDNSNNNTGGLSTRQGSVSLANHPEKLSPTKGVAVMDATGKVLN